MNRIYLISILLLCCAVLNAQTDSIPPFISCPPADTVTLGPGGDCTFQYFYAVTSGDNEPGDTLLQLSGLESGAGFPVGTTVNVFQAVDAAGNTAACSFTLTVQNYAGPLTCKNNLTVSLDSTCLWIPGAADLLDGNAGCTASGYYLLEVDKNPPYGDGPWVAAEFGADDVGKTYIFRVSDTIFNYNCTGSVQINDLLPPVLTCDSFEISCAVDNVSPYFLRDSLGISIAVPNAVDACTPILNLQHLDTTIPGSCASAFVGSISRKWTAHDGFSNSSTCIQQINLIRPQISDLRYPPDVTINCDADISMAQTGQPYVEFLGRKFTNTCSLGTAANDSVIQIAPCSRQILRTWFVIDWCTGEALDTVQVIDIQDAAGPEFQSCPDSTLTFGDTTATNDPMLWNAPHWANPPGAMENRCEGPADLHVAVSDACSGIPDLRYLLFLDLDNNGTQETVIDSDNPPAAGTVNFGNAANPNYSGGETRSFDERPVDSTLKYRFALQQIAAGDTITGRVVWNTDSLPASAETPQLPHGTHKIRWMARDSCDNESICEYGFTVKDSKAPSVTCISGLTINFPPNQTCSLTFYATDFFQDAADNCSPLPNLTFAIRRAGAGAGYPVDSSGNPNASVTFINPYDLGTQSVELWVQDQAGNADFCIATIDLQDPIGACDPSFDLDVAGNIKTEINVGIKNVSVLLQSGAFSLYNLTDDQGNYLFQNIIPMFSNYTVTPLKNTHHLDGVSTFDLVMISKHILGLESLDSPYKMIAADANRSNYITTFDIVELRKLILGIYDSLPANTSWRFVDADYIFPDPANPFQAPFPESIERIDVQNHQFEDDFIAIKTGDVNGTAIGDSLLVPDERSGGALFFDVHNREVKTGETFTVSFKAAEQVLGYQFTLDFNGLEVLEVLPGEGMTTGNFAVFPGAITASVENGAETFAIKFHATRPGRLSDMLSVSSRITRAEAYGVVNSHYGHWGHYGNSGNDSNGPNAPNDPTDFLNISLRFDDGAASLPDFELYQNQPNPFSENTRIGFRLPENTEATLHVFDETGRTLYSNSGFYPHGYHEVTLGKSLFDQTGVLYYQLQTATDCAVRKMIILK